MTGNNPLGIPQSARDAFRLQYSTSETVCPALLDAINITWTHKTTSQDYLQPEDLRTSYSVAWEPISTDAAEITADTTTVDLNNDATSEVVYRLHFPQRSGDYNNRLYWHDTPLVIGPSQSTTPIRQIMGPASPERARITDYEVAIYAVGWDDRKQKPHFGSTPVQRGYALDVVQIDARHYLVTGTGTKGPRSLR